MNYNCLECFEQFCKLPEFFCFKVFLILLKCFGSFQNLLDNFKGILKRFKVFLIVLKCFESFQNFPERFEDIVKRFKVFLILFKCFPKYARTFYNASKTHSSRVRKLKTPQDIVRIQVDSHVT